MRNWKELAWELSTCDTGLKPTYEELKVPKKEKSMLLQLGLKPTYEELKVIIL